MINLCRITGAPIKAEKVVGPSTTLTFLIKLDTQAREARLPPEKLQQLLSELQEFRTQALCDGRSTKRK